MSRRALYIFGTGALVVFADFAMASFRQTLTPYVSFEQARALERTLQVAGGLVEGSSAYDRDGAALLFTLEETETGERMRMRYLGIKPGNFEEAVSIVAIGRFDPGQELFLAEKLLVKCPSKYEGVETETTQQG